MPTARLRTCLRWLHIVFGLVILCYIYSPLHKYILFQIIVKFFVIPALVFTGVWIWKFKAFNKFFHIHLPE